MLKPRFFKAIPNGLWLRVTFFWGVKIIIYAWKGILLTYTVGIEINFFKCSDYPIGMGCPLEVECWCWRMNLRITSKIRSHKIIIKSSTECLGTQPAFNAFVPEIPTFARMCTKHQWFPIRARRHSTRWLYSHCKLHTLLILPFCKSLCINIGQGSPWHTMKEGLIREDRKSVV